jgi:hypothetical protein
VAKGNGRAGIDKLPFSFGSGCIALPLASYREFSSVFGDGQRWVGPSFFRLLSFWLKDRFWREGATESP